MGAIHQLKKRTASFLRPLLALSLATATMSSRFNQPPTERDQRYAYPTSNATDFNGPAPATNQAPGQNWAAMAAATAHVPQTFRPRLNDSEAIQIPRSTHAPTPAIHRRPASPNTIALQEHLNNGTLCSTRIRAEPTPHAAKSHKRKDLPSTRTMPEENRRTGARYGPGSSATNPTTGADNHPRTKETVQPSGTRHISSSPRPRAPANHSHPGNIAPPPTNRPQHQTTKLGVTSDDQAKTPNIFPNIYPLETFKERSRPPPAPHSDPNEKSSISKQERRNHTQQLTQPTHPTYCNNGICPAPNCNCKPPTGGWGKPKLTLPPPPPPSEHTTQHKATTAYSPPPVHTLAQSVQLTISMPLEPPRTFYLEVPLPATANDIIRYIWRKCPGQFLQQITHIHFTSTSSTDQPTSLTIKTLPTNTNAANKHIPLSPKATHFVRVELTRPLPPPIHLQQTPPQVTNMQLVTTQRPPPQHDTRSDDTGGDTPNYTPEYTPDSLHPIPSPTYSPPPTAITYPPSPTGTQPQQPLHAQPDPPSDHSSPAPEDDTMDSSQHLTAAETVEIENLDLSEHTTAMDETPTDSQPPNPQPPTAPEESPLSQPPNPSAPSAPEESPTLSQPPNPPAPTAPEGTPRAAAEERLEVQPGPHAAPKPAPTHPLPPPQPTTQAPTDARATPTTTSQTSPYLASEPSTPSTQTQPSPLVEEFRGYTLPPPHWSTATLVVTLSNSAEVVCHYIRGLRTLTTSQQPILSHKNATHHPLPFYKDAPFHAQAPTPTTIRPTNSKGRKRPETTSTPLEDARTHPFKHYVTRTSSKSQLVPKELPDHRMILTNWAYVLVALFHCSLPPYVLPESLKWLLTTTKSQGGFRLKANTLLTNASAALARDTTTPTNPNSTWE